MDTIFRCSARDLLDSGNGIGLDAGPQQAVEELAREHAPGESPAELGEVALEALGRNTVVHPPDHRLHVGCQDMDPGQLFAGRLTAAEFPLLVLEIGKAGG